MNLSSQKIDERTIASDLEALRGGKNKGVKNPQGGAVPRAKRKSRFTITTFCDDAFVSGREKKVSVNTHMRLNKLLEGAQHGDAILELYPYAFLINDKKALHEKCKEISLPAFMECLDHFIQEDSDSVDDGDIAEIGRNLIVPLIEAFAEKLATCEMGFIAVMRVYSTLLCFLSVRFLSPEPCNKTLVDRCWNLFEGMKQKNELASQVGVLLEGLIKELSNKYDFEDREDVIQGKFYHYMNRLQKNGYDSENERLRVLALLNIMIRNPCMAGVTIDKECFDRLCIVSRVATAGEQPLWACLMEELNSK